MKNRPLLSVCLIILMMVAVSIAVGGERFVKELRPSPLECIVSQGDTISLQGQIYYFEQKDKYQAVYLKNNSIQYEKQSFQESKIIVYIDPDLQVNIGNVIQAEGEVSFFQHARNPGNFDQKQYYQCRNIHGLMWAEKVTVIDRQEWKLRSGLMKFRLQWKEQLIRMMGDEDGTVLSAMMLGEKSSMDQDLRTLYQANGIAHILAISGLHLSFVGLGMYRMLRRLTGSYSVGGVAGIFFLCMYILMIGCTVSAMRALVMFLFRVGADITGRHYDAPTAFAFAAVVVLLWRPLYLFDGGFWLSFGTVLAILLVLPAFQDFAFQGIWASVSINLVLLPILLYYFFEFPLYSFLLNLFVIPLMSVLLFLGMAGSGIYVVCMPIAKILMKICGVILWIYKKGCNIAIRLPASRIVTGRPQLWQIAVYYVVLCMVLLLLWKKSNRCKVLAAALLGMAVFVLGFRWGEDGKMMTTILDVGQGDGIFIKGPDGGTYLIDGGSSDVKKIGQYRIEPFLKSQGVSNLDYVIVTHGDSDHMNGIEELIDRKKIGVTIDTLVLPVQEVWGEELVALAERAKKEGIRVVVIAPGQEIMEEELTLTCLQPGEAEEGLETGNETSMVMAVSYGEYDMLLTGDVEGKGEEELTDLLKHKYKNCSWEVLKVAHHGSKNSSSKEFLDVVKPRYAIISAGQKSRYGHPHRETIARLEEAECKIKSTQETGAVMIIIHKNEMYIKWNCYADNS